jgi:hypothetical protein
MIREGVYRVGDRLPEEFLNTQRIPKRAQYMWRHFFGPGRTGAASEGKRATGIVSVVSLGGRGNVYSRQRMA